MLTRCRADPAVVAEMGSLLDYSFALTPWAPLPDIVCSYTGWTAAQFSDKFFAR